MTSVIFHGLTILEEALGPPGWRARLRVEPSSRAFAGHFDGEPILPGIAHLVIVRHALRSMGGAALAALSAVRFRRIVRPDDVLDVVVAAPDPEGLCRFDVRVEDMLAASGVARTRARV